MNIRLVAAASSFAVVILAQCPATLANPSPGIARPVTVEQVNTRAALRYAQAQAPAQAPQQTPAAPTAPIRTEILRFDSWTATCHEFAEAARKRTCNAQMQIQVQQQQQQQQQAGAGHVALTWTLFINDQKQLVMVLQTPTGVTIAPGVELTLDKAPKRTIPFESCDTGSCTASHVVDNNLMRELSAAANVQLTIRALNGNGVNFNFPVKGTDKAVNYLRSKI